MKFCIKNLMAYQVILLLWLSLPLAAQYREYYLTGQIQDMQKQPLAGVEIELFETDNRLTFSAKTNQEGKFKFRMTENDVAAPPESRPREKNIRRIVRHRLFEDEIVLIGIRPRCLHDVNGVHRISLIMQHEILRRHTILHASVENGTDR